MRGFRDGAAALTLHCCACWLWEEWNEQEIDEVDEGQDVVPEKASCGEKKRIHLQMIKKTTILLRVQNPGVLKRLKLRFSDFNYEWRAGEGAGFSSR